MPEIDRIDLLSGTSLYQSAQDRQTNRGQRGVVVKDLTPGQSLAADLAEAEAYLLDQLNDKHPADSSLPIQGVQLQNLRPSLVAGTVLYGHSQASNPTLDPWRMARCRYFNDRRAPRATRVYRDGAGEKTSETFLVTETLVFDDPFIARGEPGETLYVILSKIRLPVFQIDVPVGLLADNPLDVMEDLVGKVNADDVVIDDFTFVAGRLKFIAPQWDSIDRQGEVKRPTFYSFHYCPGGWGSATVVHGQVLVGEPDEVGRKQIVYQWTVVHDPYDDEDFADAFPTFNGSGPPAADESSSSGA